MKKYAPYLLIAIVGLILVILIYRWFQSRKPTPQILPAGVSIETLPEEEQVSLIRGTNDYQEIQLEPAKPSENGLPLGVVRYLVNQGKLKLSAITQLPTTEASHYYLWIKPAKQDQFQLVAQLEVKKGGVLGSAVLPVEALPVEVVISRTNIKDQVLNQAVLKAVIPVSPGENKL